MVTAILLSGGMGSRAGFDIPKQYMKAGDRTIISYCIETLSLCDKIDFFTVVANKDWHDAIMPDIDMWDSAGKFIGFCDPGESRQLSIINGLKYIEGKTASDDIVMIHDAARPLLTIEDIEKYVVDCVGHDGILPVLPMKDTVYLSNGDGKVSGLLDRSKVFAGQAPEFFVFQKYLEANNKLGDKIALINGSTEPAIMAQMDIAMVPGNENNFKITTKADYERFVEILKNNSI